MKLFLLVLVSLFSSYAFCFSGEGGGGTGPGAAETTQLFIDVKGVDYIHIADGETLFIDPEIIDSIARDGQAHMDAQAIDFIRLTNGQFIPFTGLLKKEETEVVFFTKSPAELAVEHALRQSPSFDLQENGQYVEIDIEPIVVDGQDIEGLDPLELFGNR